MLPSLNALRIFSTLSGVYFVSFGIINILISPQVTNFNAIYTISTPSTFTSKKFLKKFCRKKSPKAIFFLNFAPPDIEGLSAPCWPPPNVEPAPYHLGSTKNTITTTPAPLERWQHTGPDWMHPPGDPKQTKPANRA